ncbi:MAG: hypothetical protein A2V66_11735 [Ignavibacteria bacterium RBG_13_36_8]|nr:MAG: hypothetical protein A2V66_11735 [Ignavibacteria bacterium RBG_13_36_8]
MIKNSPRIGFIGFGEVAYHLAIGLKESGIEKIFAFDAANQSTNQNRIIINRSNEIGAELQKNIEQVIKNSDLIISAVHGNAALDVAIESAKFLTSDKIYADINNTSPSTKLKIAKAVNDAGAKFVDLELFETPARAKHKSLMYMSGDGAVDFLTIMDKFGMSPKIIEGSSNKACEIKVLTNIYYKGLQALCLELGISANKAGIDLDLIASLVVQPVKELPDDSALAFWIFRGAIHAGRKAAELRDINQAIKDWGVEPIMMDAAMKRLELIARYNLKDHMDSEVSLENYKSILTILAKGTELN